ncbi:hypothetical protein Q5H92_21785 [Hymenobacter sp. M29]|uniref:Uncharacterized protein n=1 Tax=Hymenobacter mellowenesis TaxID=3063995 RepID=A0ABT9AGL6_9BACT|nr:hypothetical protein [Hymenobacter sp. M29]MDO7849011.1 hypothetical protein [Hymenobacter sp. M29]
MYRLLFDAGQLEALLDFIRENAAAPVLSAPHLLAVLFMPVDAAEQSADVVSAAAEASEQRLAESPRSFLAIHVSTSYLSINLKCYLLWQP